ncbi:MAG TPA: trypsin-like peptidase domain-containing protein [Candidatus Krumholzibacteria bacterium]|nr:trypsin-like peptidase domain-containing protein [Candidatus Krumholzibacteria bacterium]
MTLRSLLAAAALSVAVGLALPAAAQEAKDFSLTEFSSEIRTLTTRVSPAVVQIYTSSFGALMGSVPEGAAVFGSQQATGSGVIVDGDGYILTNNHVVAGARRVQVRLSPEAVGAEEGSSIVRTGGAMVGAQVLGVDPETDLAVLKINRKGLPTLELGDSDEVYQGQLVFAFGSPLGLTGSVSFGVVSTVARQLDRDNPMIYIQSDVAVNPGNSGGPLVGADGRVVGINTLIMSQSGGSEGLSFSVPSNIARTVYNQIRAGGRVKRGIIGVNPQTVNPWIAEALQLPVQWGVILGDVIPGGPADKAGLKVGDIVTALDGKKMENARQFRVNLYGKTIGGKVMVEVLREGRPITKQVEVIERVDPDFRFFEMISSERNLVPRIGILGLDLDNDARRMLPSAPRGQNGVIVAALAVDTSLLGERFTPGDIIYAMNGQAVESLKDLKDKVKALPYGQTAVFQVERGGQLQYLMLQVE